MSINLVRVRENLLWHHASFLLIDANVKMQKERKGNQSQHEVPKALFQGTNDVVAMTLSTVIGYYGSTIHKPKTVDSFEHLCRDRKFAVRCFFVCVDKLKHYKSR